MNKADGVNKEIRLPEINIYIAVYMFIWVILLIFMMWKAGFGAASYDESLYLTIPYRLSQGDAMITDEWNLSQLSSFATVPFVYIYSHLSGGTDGITLAYRYYSVIIWSLAAFWAYCGLRRYSKVGAMLGSFVFMIYAPFGLMVMSYNTYAILVLVLAGLILLPGPQDRMPSHIRWMTAGFLYAYSVLCCPQILLIWGIGFIYSVIKKNLRSFIDFTLGAAGLALVLFIYILSRASIGRILEAVPVMLKDPYHQPVSLWGYFKDYIIQVLFGIPNAVWIYICFAVLIMFVIFDRKKDEHSGLYFTAGCLLTFALLVMAWIFRRYINCFVYPVNILALLCILLQGHRESLSLVRCFYIPGMLYSFCIDMSSNQYWLAISSASIVALLGSVVIICMFLGSIIKDRKRKETAPAVFGVTMLAVIIPLLSLRYSFVFMDSTIYEQTELIEEGPQKGIRASAEDKEVYQKFCNDMKEIEMRNPERVLIFARDNWPYLTGLWRCGAYSPWLQNEIDDFAVDMLLSYYEMDASREPDIIYVDKKYEEYGNRLINEMDYVISEVTPSGNSIAVPR